jgi:hypothetical protein
MGCGVAVAMAVPEHRPAGAQGVTAAAQALFGDVTAIAIGALYEGPGTATGYTAVRWG